MLRILTMAVQMLTEPNTSAQKQTTGARTLVHHFWQQTEDRAASPALYFSSDARKWLSISWGDFGSSVKRVACYLIDQGMGEGSHIAIWSTNRPEWHIADMSILSIRACPVPIYYTLSAVQVHYILEHSETEMIFVDSQELLDRVLSVRDSLPKLRQIIVMGMDQSPTQKYVVAWSQVVGALGMQAAEKHAAELQSRIDSSKPEDVATLIYTSGTTGPPKSVMLTHANLESGIDCLESAVKGSETDRQLSYLPLAHVAERIASEVRSYYYGNPTYFVSDIRKLTDALQSVQPTTFFAVPRVWEKMTESIRGKLHEASGLKRGMARWAINVGQKVGALRSENKRPGPWLALNHAIADKLVLSKVRRQLGLAECRFMVSGAAPIGPDVLLFFRSLGLDIAEAYGQTENSALATMNPPHKIKIGTVGPALAGTELKIAEDGEILMRGPTMFPGYFKNPEATAEVLIDGWLHTGDVGELDADGYLKITDRKKDLIITAGGKNISPTNLELAMKQCPLVANAVAIGDRRPYVTALLTLDVDGARRFAKDHGLSTDDWDAFVANQLVDAEVDRYVQTLNSRLSQVERVKKWKLLPHDFTLGDELTPTLKVKRKVVAEKYATEIESLYDKSG